MKSTRTQINTRHTMTATVVTVIIGDQIRGHMPAPRRTMAVLPPAFAGRTEP
jgi:hypothetical protein